MIYSQQSKSWGSLYPWPVNGHTWKATKIWGQQQYFKNSMEEQWDGHSSQGKSRQKSDKKQCMAHTRQTMELPHCRSKMSEEHWKTTPGTHDDWTNYDILEIQRQSGRTQDAHRLGIDGKSNDGKFCGRKNGTVNLQQASLDMEKTWANGRYNHLPNAHDAGMLQKTNIMW